MEALLNETVRGIIGRPMAHAFECMSIAGEELEASGLDPVGPNRHPHGAELWAMLAPSDIFEHCDLRVFRAHVRELLERARTGAPLDVGTKAEVLLGLVETSLVAPLSPTGVTIHHWLFRDIFGAEVHDKILEGSSQPAEPWAGRRDEMFAECARKVKTGRPAKLGAKPKRGKRGDR